MNPLLATTSLPPPNPADDPADPPAAADPARSQGAEGPPDPPDTDDPPAADASPDPRAPRPPPLPRFLTYARLRLIVPYTRQHLSRLERAGRFPRRVKLGPGRVAWAEDEVRAWLEARKAERRGRVE